MSQLKVKFFASLREQLGSDSVELAWTDGQSIQVLIDLLKEQLGEAANILDQSEILVAVNQTMVDRDHHINAQDEIAFLPPVTGG